MRHAVRLPVSVARVHRDVVEIALVREQADLAKAQAGRLDLGVAQQQAAEAAALPAWGDGHVLQPQVIASRLELDHADQATVQLEHPDLVLAQRVRVVDEHGQRGATDQRFVVPVRGSDELRDGFGIGRGGPAQRRREVRVRPWRAMVRVRCRSS